MRVLMAGEGAIARKHLDGLARIDGIEVICLVGGNAENTKVLAETRGISQWSTNLTARLSDPSIDAVILTTPTQMHASQAIEVLQAGKHVLVEIPMADNLADAQRLVDVQRATGRTAMVCHTRRFNPSHQHMHNKIIAGELKLQHLVVETFFFRRTNTNALGVPRTWTDHLLWHHACHTVDLFQYQTQEIPDRVWAQQGPLHPELGIAMDMTVGMKMPSGTICSLALSFNNAGPFGTFFRYICDSGTYIARYDDLVDGHEEPIDVSKVDVSLNGIELQDREFFAAIREGRVPNADVGQCLPAMQTLDALARSLNQQ